MKSIKFKGLQPSPNALVDIFSEHSETLTDIPTNPKPRNPEFGVEGLGRPVEDWGVWLWRLQRSVAGRGSRQMPRKMLRVLRYRVQGLRLGSGFLRVHRV